MKHADAFGRWAEIVAQAGPRIAIILGSGMGGVADRLQNPRSISFNQIPVFEVPSVAGHKGCLTFGTWAGIPVLVFEGRLHFYEGHSWRKVVAPVMTAKTLGITHLVFTNAAGGIHKDLSPGSMMVIRDHIEWTKPYFWQTANQSNPLSKRTSPYSNRLNGVLQNAARTLNIDLHFGNYGALMGPCYETPAEIRALESLGADAVGMSTAREVQTAFDVGIECLALSCITNRAAGLNGGTINHEEVLSMACMRSDVLASLLEKCLLSL